VWLRHDSFMIAYAVPLCKQTFPTAQILRFAGKKVSLRRRQQADMPNHCSSSNKSVYKLLWYCCTCNALRVFRYATQFVILLAVPSPSFGQLLCPSRHFVHYFLRSASLHLVRSYPFASRPGFAVILNAVKDLPMHTANHQPFASQPYNTHWVSFRCTTSFIHISIVQSTRCLLFGSPAAHFGCVHLATANCSFVPHFAKHR